MALDPFRLRPSKCFRNNNSKSQVTTIDFSDNGEWCISSASDESLQIYDCRRGKHSKTLFSKKYGIHLARFTHHSMNAIYASTKEDDTIRYLSLHDNHYIRYFRGHKGQVISLEMSPANDQFLSASLDNTVRLWDLRSQYYHGLLNLPAPTVCAFDPTGIVFAIASTKTRSISLYDLRHYDKEPFSTFFIDDDSFLSKFSYPPCMPDWARIEFSNDGKLLLINTRHGEAHYVLDAFKGELKYRLVGYQAPNVSHINAGDTCFTPDGQYVFAASRDGTVAVYDCHQKAQSDLTLGPAVFLDATQFSPMHTLLFNPKYAMLATANEEMVRKEVVR